LSGADLNSVLANRADLYKIAPMMRKSVWVAPLAALFVLGACTPEKPKTFAFKYAEKRATLDNGMRLVVIPDKTTPLVQVDIRYEVGSNQDPPGKAGLAHFAEHLMFQWSGPEFYGKDEKGDPRNGPALFTLIPTFAHFYNAYTNWDTTHYFLQGRKEDLNILLDVEAKRLRMAMKAGKADCSEAMPAVPRSEFFRELEVVRNEIRLRMGSPEAQVMHKILAESYPEGHPYRDMIGGKDAGLATIQPKDACEFLRKWYIPQNAVMVVVGNVDPDEVGRLVQGYFGTIPKGEQVPIDKIDLVELKKEKIEVKADVERPQVNVVWRLPPMDSDDWPAANVMLGSFYSRASRWAEEWGFAARVNIGVLGGRRAPIFVFTAELYKNSDVDEALDYIWKAASGASRGTDEIEYRKESKNLAKARFVEQMESISNRAGTVADLIQFGKRVKFTGDEEFLLDELKRIDELGIEDYSNYIKRELKKDKALVIVVKKDDDVKLADKRDKRVFKGDPHKVPVPPVDPADASRPEKFPETKSILGNAERYELGNGMKVVLLPTNSMPVVHAQMVFNAGGAQEDAAKAGLAELSAGFLRNDAAMFSLSSLGARVFGYGGIDSSTFIGRGMEIYLEFVLKGIERYLTVGDYDQEMIERWHKRFKLSNELASVQQNTAFYEELSKAVYGADHPYTTKGSATLKTYKKLGRDNAISFRNKWFGAKNATLIVVGSFDPVQAKKHIQSNFGGFRKGTKAEPISQGHAPRDKPVYIGVVRDKERPASTVQILYPAPAGIDSDHAARLVLASMLNERMRVIREKLGSTYGTRAGKRTRKGPSVYQLGGAVDTQRLGESLKVMREEIDRLRGSDPVTFNTDFVKARKQILKSLLGESTETYSLAGKLAQIAEYDLAPTYYDDLVKEVATMTPAKIQALVKKELDPSREVIGIMSDKKALQKAFKEAGIEGAKIIEPNL
jgi:zinc protease